MHIIIEIGDLIEKFSAWHGLQFIFTKASLVGSSVDGYFLELVSIENEDYQDIWAYIGTLKKK